MNPRPLHFTLRGIPVPSQSPQTRGVRAMGDGTGGADPAVAARAPGDGLTPQGWIDMLLGDTALDVPPDE